MQAALFKLVEESEFIDFHYVGSSFDHQIDIDKLAKELDGASQALRKAILVSAHSHKIVLSLKDITILVEPFMEGSFRKKIKIITKHLNKNTGAYSVMIGAGALICGILTLVKNTSPTEIISMSPQFQAEIGDVVKVSLLKDKTFMKDLAAFSAPLVSGDDKLVLTASSSSEVEIGMNEKEKLEKIAAVEEDLTEHETMETLIGKITRVDLDATINHIGFKLEDRGSTIKGTFAFELSQNEKRNLLGQWVKLSGVVTYQGEERVKVDITEIKEVMTPRQEIIQLPARVNLRNAE